VALRAQLPKQAGLSGPSNPLMRAFGGLRDLHRESKRLENASYKGSSGALTRRNGVDTGRELKITGTPIPSDDAWIASLAREHRLPVVTRDVHFQALRGLHVLMW
jgi:hypothetical protein